MKVKRILVLTFLFTLFFNINALANERNINSAIFMGNVKNIEQGENNDLRVTFNGYIKGEKIYKDEITGIITNDTYIIPSTCSCNENEVNITKVDINNLNIKEDDVVFCILDEAMTKSIPPQVRVKAIQISS